MSVQLSSFAVMFLQLFMFASLITGIKPPLLRCRSSVVSVPRLQDMTLHEKIGQMIIVRGQSVRYSSALISQLKIGAILVEPGYLPWWVKSGNDWADMSDHFQGRAALSRLKIPLLIGVDAIHGHNSLVGATIFPHQIGLGATRDASLVYDVTAAAAKEVVGTGIRWCYAPVLSVCRDPRWGRCYETFSEAPEIAAPLGAAATKAWQTLPPESSSSSLLGSLFLSATAKHFVGDGGTTGGVDKGNAEYSQQQMDDIFLPPFKAAIEKGVGSAMASYNMWNGTRVHTSKYLLTDVLRGQLGFKGMLTSDNLGVQWVNGTTHRSKIRQAVNAGIDIFMMSYGHVRFFKTLRREILAGRIPMSRIDDAVTNILALKQSLGLFAGGRCSPRQFLQYVGCQVHRDLARQAVRQSLVLLKNSKRGSGGGGSVFPLPLSGARVLVTGSHANDIGMQCGGWTITWNGMAGNTTIGTTIYQGICDAAAAGGVAAVTLMPQPNSTEGWGALQGNIRSFNPSLSVVVVGEWPYSEKKGDDNTLQLADGSARLVQDVCNASSALCVVVLISGRPVTLTPILPHVDALVAAWLPGSEGAGIADVLFDSSIEFRGRVPVTWFKSVGQLPMVYGDSDFDPLFPLGSGLKKDGSKV